ncbi:hypothetical protein RDI58_027334 [Solanum bulbocastanum]|uniref:Uncharacterized protein n=1 Tax=Solanum bulbocastanum TaxID=147425 RepID=A0AAN8T273_SOLBU
MVVDSANGNLQENYENQLVVPEKGLCLFVDAGLQVEPNKASIGLIAMDSKCILLLAHGSPIHFVGRFTIVEAFAITKVVEKSIQMNGNTICLL